MELHTSNTLDTAITRGELLTVSSVTAANIVKDIRENIRNLTGGSMSHYESLIDNSLEIALDKMKTKASDKGYDGVIGLTISHPRVVDGGVEIIVYGNGFNYTG